MAREPDEHPHAGGTGGADDFDAIVSGWRREGSVPEWPAEDDLGQAGSLAEPPDDAPDPAELDHFVPPEPPPLPRLGPPALVGLGMLGLGLILVLVPQWLGMPAAYGLPLGLLALAAGLGWLVLRLWPTPTEHGHDGDDGAVL